MSDQWYVWLLGRWLTESSRYDHPEWSVIGVYSTAEKAKAAGRKGERDFIMMLAMDDTATDLYQVADWL